jgi:hypothetical protein
MSPYAVLLAWDSLGIFRACGTPYPDPIVRSQNRGHEHDVRKLLSTRREKVDIKLLQVDHVFQLSSRNYSTPSKNCRMPTNCCLKGPAEELSWEKL